MACAGALPGRSGERLEDSGQVVSGQAWARVANLEDRLRLFLPRAYPHRAAAALAGCRVNRAVAVGLAVGPAAGLAALKPLAAEPQLAGDGYLAATRADFLRRLGRLGDARTAYEEALLLTGNEVERRFLIRQLDGLAGR